MSLDIEANRQARKWTRRELLIRALWELAYPAFRFSPRVLWGWRRFLLRTFGAAIGRHVHVAATVRIAVPFTILGANYRGRKR